MSSTGCPTLKATTIVAIKHRGTIAIGADGQATLGSAVVKSNVQKIRKLAEGSILAGFAGSTADAFALLERFEAQLNVHAGNMHRAAIELAKAWRLDRYLRKLEAMMIILDRSQILTISGNGDVMRPENDIATIGSGGMYAHAAALTLKKHQTALSAEQMVRESLKIAADICIYTNDHITVETLS